jgi:hypothetical protein
MITIGPKREEADMIGSPAWTLQDRTFPTATGATSIGT